MNIKIKLAYFAIALSILSFVGVFWSKGTFYYSPEIGAIGVFAIFAIGCFIYSYIALRLFKRERDGSSPKALLGSFIAMIAVLIIHMFIIIATSTSLLFQHGEGWQFLLTLFGIIPAMIIGAIVGGIFDLFGYKRAN